MQKSMQKSRQKTLKAIKEKPYTEAEWRKIEKLSTLPGKVYNSVKSAKKHISALVKPGKTV